MPADLEERAAVDRLLLFSDAVVAIAITLLVLPLVDLAGEDASVGDLWRDHRGQFVAFALSFVVIARLWIVHHSVLRAIPRCSPALVWADMVWLATIVFLPFTTELLGGPRGDDSATQVVYVASILACTLAFDLLGSVSNRLRTAAGDQPPSLVPGYVTSALAAAALVVVAAVPDLGLWPLLLLLLETPITALVARIRDEPT